MFLVLYPLNTVKVFWDELDIAFLTRSWTGEMPGWMMVGLYLALDAWAVVFHPDSGIGHLSHLVGGLTGVALAVVLLRSGWLFPDLGEQTLLMWLAGKGPAERDGGAQRGGRGKRRIVRAGGREPYPRWSK
jgi:hypothetical protein